MSYSAILLAILQPLLAHSPPVKFNSYPTPPHLFRQYENGEISREELQATMALHARGLIEEMEEANKNPKTSYLERLRNHAAVRKIVKKHGRAVLRESLAVLGDIADFPPAQILWNASHGSVPLHCFIRSRIEPVFRITRFDVQPMFLTMEVEYGAHAKDRTTRESFLLQRNAALKLELAERIQL
ncbi:hypothetical protein VSU19_01245 [Verrucomicrobiales bacterium BCK34]|nr:hypothetical protein [Verrucomicrobiales bacterium BCK34]